MILYIKMFKNVQKGQLKELMSKQCSACGEKGFGRGTCSNRIYCHSFAVGCLVSKHQNGDSKFPCGAVCGVCEEAGHTVDKCRMACKRCTTTTPHAYRDSQFACGIECEMCGTYGHDCENCKLRCRKSDCDPQPHKFKDVAYKCSQPYQSPKVSCSLCGKQNHQTDSCRMLCYSVRCRDTQPHKFGNSSFECGKPKDIKSCLYCLMSGHTVEKCRKICRSDKCKELAKHLYASEVCMHYKA
jgi:hypothetical protein